MALETYTKWGACDVERGFPDVADPGAIKEFKQYFRMADKDTEPYAKISKDRDWGIGIVRKLIRVPGTVDDTKLLIHPSCKELCDEIVLYRTVIDPELDAPTDRIRKKQDHAVDALRYMCAGIFGIIIPKYTYFDRLPSNMGNYSLPIPKEEAIVRELPPIGDFAIQIGRNDFSDNSNEFTTENGKIVEKDKKKSKKPCKFILA